MSTSCGRPTCMTCGGHDIRTFGEVADDREYAITCFDCGCSVVITLDGFRVFEPRRVKRRPTAGQGSARRKPVRGQPDAIAA